MNHQPPAGRGLLVFMLGAAAGVAGAVGGTVFAGREPGRDALPWEDVRLLTEVLERVRQEYVEPVDDQRLLENAARGMVTNLDPHSQFLDADEYEEMRISTSGNYSGVGIEVNLRDGRVLVVAPIEGTPADAAGIRSGDVIVSIDDEAVSGDNVTDAVTRLRGRPGTTVRLTVSRAGEPALLTFDLVRSNVQVHSVRSRVLEPGIAYLRISQFSETTGADLGTAMGELRRQPGGAPVRGLVIDLRNNPGGVLDAAIEVSDDFLDSGTIVTASGRGPDATFRHEARPGDVVDGAPIVVLVNGGSASASEIVAGALQDNHRATIVGSRTFGKGSVQTVMPLSRGRAIKLTTSRYFTPSGDSINGEGITPDVVLEDVPAGGADAADAALKRAVDLLRAGSLLQSRAR
ncbi:MAG: S41 family peptidase [Gammaproteobacteria bacterium]|nr:S41 family peptidase [Gammaproteobacteria bacterium]